MDLKAIIAAARVKLDDVEKPYLWSDDELAQYAADAEQEAAIRGLLLSDAETADICEIVTEAGVAEYDLHALILHIDRAKIDGQTTPLRPITREELDLRSPNWEAETGDPARFIDDVGTLTLYPKPAAAGMLRLRVKRLPVKPMALSEKTRGPEIHAQHHARLLDWVARCAYLKPDADAFSADKAATHEARFEQSFGALPDANVRRKQRARRKSVVKYGGL